MQHLELKHASLMDCDKATLVDITEIKIDDAKPSAERMIDFIQKVKNPYLFRVGDVAVKIKFEEGAERLQKKIESLILANLGR